MKTPPASVLSQALGIPKGSATPNTAEGGQDFAQAARRYRQDEDADLTAGGLDAAVRTIAGSARSMAVDVEGV